MLFSRRWVRKTLRVKSYHYLMLFKSNLCFVVVNLLQLYFISVLIVDENLSEMRYLVKSVRNYNVRNFFATNVICCFFHFDTLPYRYGKICLKWSLLPLYLCGDMVSTDANQSLQQVWYLQHTFQYGTPGIPRDFQMLFKLDWQHGCAKNFSPCAAAARFREHIPPHLGISLSTNISASTSSSP